MTAPTHTTETPVLPARRACTWDLSVRCEALEAVLHDEANDMRTGLTLVVLTSQTTNVERIAGVAARKAERGRKAVWIYFNACPFCRTEIIPAASAPVSSGNRSEEEGDHD